MLKKHCDTNKIFWIKRIEGFTLIELLVALAVVSIAITALVQLFILSLNLTQTSQNAILASNIAYEKINYLKNCPEKFIWKIPDTSAQEEVFPILTSEDEAKAGNVTEIPIIAPPDWASFRNYKNVSQKFRWKAFGKLLPEEKGYYEIVVTVIYKEFGRTKYYTVNSIIPRFQIDKVIKK
ncbi:MAG: type IV pilus modification PilV family protein [Candidatus Hydrogenedens sp.]